MLKQNQISHATAYNRYPKIFKEKKLFLHQVKYYHLAAQLDWNVKHYRNYIFLTLK